MDKYKTTKEQYDLFKKSFLYWHQKLGLIRYNIHFRLGADEDNYAQVGVNIEFRTAVIRFTEFTTDKADYDTMDPILMGKHEAMHLLTAELRQLALSRYATELAIESAEEAIVAALVNVLKEEEV